MMSKKKQIFLEWYPFVFVFLLMCVYLIPKGSMATLSGDAAEMWKTITTYGTENEYASYVLYKGILALYPFVWLYRLAVLLGTNEWLFIMFFYCFSFAYITTIGFPTTIDLLTKSKTVHYRKIILAVICFYFWEPTMALSQFMVDLPALMYFLLFVNSALRIYKDGTNVKRLLWAGLWLGFNLGGSGQYTTPAFCVVIFLAVVILRQSWTGDKLKIKQLLGNVAWILISALPLKLVNSYFLNGKVEAYRQAGVWLPTSGEWLKIGFSRFMEYYRVGMGNAIPSNLNQAVFQAHLGAETFAEMQEFISAGGYGMTMAEYLKLVLQYPVSFAFCYLEKFFLVLSPDRGGFYFLPLFLFYTMLFITLYLLVKNCRKIKDIIDVRFWIYFAFLWAVVPCLVMVLEARCAIQIQGLILAIALCRDEIWHKAKEICCNIRKLRKPYNFFEMKMPYVFLLYVCFVVICFLHMSSLYEGIGVDANRIIMQFW